MPVYIFLSAFLLLTYPFGHIHLKFKTVFENLIKFHISVEIFFSLNIWYFLIFDNYIGKFTVRIDNVGNNRKSVLNKTLLMRSATVLCANAVIRFDVLVEECLRYFTCIFTKIFGFPSKFSNSVDKIFCRCYDAFFFEFRYFVALLWCFDNSLFNNSNLFSNSNNIQ